MGKRVASNPRYLKLFSEQAITLAVLADTGTSAISALTLSIQYQLNTVAVFDKFF